MQDFNELLKLTDAGDFPNRLSAENVKTWLGEYHDARSQEMSRFGDLANRPHWDMLVADYDSTKEAYFIAAYFCDNTVTFLAGSGVVNVVREFAEHEFPDDPEQLLDDLSKRFSTSSRVVLSVDEVMAWIHR